MVGRKKTGRRVVGVGRVGQWEETGGGEQAQFSAGYDRLIIEAEHELQATPGPRSIFGPALPYSCRALGQY